jgi:hypothetical protein
MPKTNRAACMDGVVERLIRTHPANIRQHFAVIVSSDGRKVLAWGASRLTAEGFDHAEENAVRELASRKYDGRALRRLTMIVARSTNDKLRASKPCVDCCRLIRNAHMFQWVCYSTSEGVYERVRARDLHSEYMSTGRAAMCAERAAAAAAAATAAYAC